MPKFSKKSVEKLLTCDARLIAIMQTAILETDFTIICGVRGQKEQDLAFKQGKSKLRYPKSKHNSIPSLAVDIAPYPLDWNNIQAFDDLSKVIKRIAHE